jgi:predicted DNA-binding transcriptional regulator AlpA
LSNYNIYHTNLILLYHFDALSIDLKSTISFLVLAQTKKSKIMSEIIITTISKNEIKQLIEGAVQKAILKNQNLSDDQNTSFIDVNKAAEFLGIAKATLYGKCSKKLIPHLKKGKKLYFDQKELIGWLKSGKRKTINDINESVNPVQRHEPERHSFAKVEGKYYWRQD